MFHDASTNEERAKGGIGADFTRLLDVFLITALNANAAAIDEIVAAIIIAHCLANNALIGTINHRLIIDGRNRHKKETRVKITRVSCKVAASYSPAFAVPSALQGLTSLFGMVRGGALVL